MHRAPWSRTSASGAGRYTSFQSSTRTGIGRSRGFFRLMSMKPVTLPMGRTHELGERGFAVFRARPRFRGQHALVISRNDLDEAGPFVLPVRQQPHGAPAVRVSHVAPQQFANGLEIFG